MIQALHYLALTHERINKTGNEAQGSFKSSLLQAKIVMFLELGTDSCIVCGNTSKFLDFCHLVTVAALINEIRDSIEHFLLVTLYLF